MILFFATVVIEKASALGHKIADIGLSCSKANGLQTEVHLMNNHTLGAADPSCNIFVWEIFFLYAKHERRCDSGREHPCELGSMASLLAPFFGCRWLASDLHLPGTRRIT